MKLKILLFFYLINLGAVSYSQQQFRGDSLRVEELNAYAFKIRSQNPEKAISTGKQALRLAEKIDFELGKAEAYRVIGVGYSSLDETDTAMSKYMLALTLFKKHADLLGEARVYNNIGNRYKYYDPNKALSFYLKSLAIAQKQGFEELIAGCYLNIANIFTLEKRYSNALKYIDKSYAYFQEKKDTSSVILASVSKANLLIKMKKFSEAETLLLKIQPIVEKRKAHTMLSSIHFNLGRIYIATKQFEKSENSILGGLALVKQLGDNKFEKDFLKIYYELEYARKNYKDAAKYLQQVFSGDSVIFNELQSKKFTLHQEQFEFLQKEQETKILLEKQKTNRIKYIAAVIVLALSLVVIALLIIQSRKKAKTLQKMRELNEEISVQKENLDKINQNLEGIIAERTEDLKTKNLKLSQYSSHLSHEIRSPVTTIKGLLLLDDEDLIDDQELISEVKRCVEDIDSKLLNINYMLHNPQYKAFILPENSDGIIPPPDSEQDENI